jgi:DNA mismatch endonuclease (patch repair protein)
MAQALFAEGLAWEGHARDLPGRPDFVFRAERLAVFVDGDFWHGWKFQEWRDKLSESWEAKIATNRRRDVRNRKALRADGWTVIRFWEHQVDRSPKSCARRVRRELDRYRRSDLQPGQAGDDLVAGANDPSND